MRSKVKFWDQDRYMKPDIDAVVELIRSGKVVESIAEHLAKLDQEPGYAPVLSGNVEAQKKK